MVPFPTAQLSGENPGDLFLLHTTLEPVEMEER